MRKNLFYLFLVLVLGLATYWFVFREENTGFELSEANFNVKDTSKIQQIFMSDLKGNKITLARKGVQWILNDNAVPNSDMLHLLLSALKEQNAQQPVTLNYHDKVVTDIAGNNVKVEVYDNSGKTHSFYVGKDPSPNNLTYMITEGAKRPFIVKLPFENAFVGLRYNTDFDTWRSKKIMFQSSQIETIDVIYKDSTQYSFRVDVKGDDVKIMGNQVLLKPLNTKRAKSFVRLMDELYCMGYDNKNFEREAILASGRQLGTFKIKRKNNQVDEMVVYFRPTDKGTKGVINLDNKEYDVDFYYGWLNQKDFVGIGSANIKKMFRMYPEFYEADSIK
jgi:hypothetical protein